MNIAFDNCPPTMRGPQLAKKLPGKKMSAEKTSSGERVSRVSRLKTIAAIGVLVVVAIGYVISWNREKTIALQQYAGEMSRLKSLRADFQSTLTNATDVIKSEDDSRFVSIMNDLKLNLERQEHCIDKMRLIANAHHGAWSPLYVDEDTSWLLDGASPNDVNSTLKSEIRRLEHPQTLYAALRSLPDNPKSRKENFARDTALRDRLLEKLKESVKKGN